MSENNGALEVARQVADAVRASAEAIGVPVTVWVVDPGGHTILTERMDGAGVVSLVMAERKAWTSAMVGMATSNLTPLVQPGEPLYGLTHADGGRFVALGGGIPLMRGDTLVGAVGVSGGTVEEDTALAVAGVDAVRSALVAS